MDEEGCIEYQFDYIRQNCGDMIESNSFLGQLPCQIGESKIGCGQPYLVTNGVGGASDHPYFAVCFIQP